MVTQGKISREECYSKGRGRSGFLQPDLPPSGVMILMSQAAAHPWSGDRDQPTYSLPFLKSYYYYIATSGSERKGQSSYP